MTAVWMRVRAEARARWRSWLLLALAFGVASGASIGAFAGARRTASAYPRFYERNRGYDVFLGGIGAGDQATIERMRAAIAALPQVAGTAEFRFASMTMRLADGSLVTFPDILAVGDPTGSDGVTLNIAHAIRGRLADSARADEATVDWLVADRLGLDVGDRVDIQFMRFARGEPTFTYRTVRIVGVTIAPGQVPAAGQATFGVLRVTPAFLRVNEGLLEPSNDAPFVVLERGASDIPAFLDALAQLPQRVDVVGNRTDHLHGAHETLRFESTALWVLGVLIALAAVGILGQALARTAAVESEDFVALAAVGMSRRALTMVGVIRAAIVAVVALPVAAAVAIAVSPLTPIGISRLVEPDPGVTVDPWVLALGLLATLLIIPLLGLGPAWRAARTRPKPSAEGRSGRIAMWLTSRSVPVPMWVGVRMALDPGRGRRAVPTRSAVFGSLVGSAALVAALAFASSLSYLLQTPALFGFNWDVLADMGGKVPAAVRTDPDVDVYGRGGAFNVSIDGTPLIPFVYDPGPIEPTILSGKVPETADEIALGPQLLRRLGYHVGESVDVVFGQERDGPRARMRIVGVTVVPPVFFQAVKPGEGAALTIAAIERNAPGQLREGLPTMVRYRSGVDIHAKLGALRGALPFMFAFQIREPGGDLVSLVRVQDVPVALAALLGLLALAAMVHVLTTSVRRRRRDLAILKTLGFVGRQVRASVAWQATTLAITAVVIGAGLGVVAGRWSWTSFASTLGVLNVPRAPILGIGLVVPGALLLANVVAALPARAAARTQAAVVLRSE